jgi:N-acyl-D-amino-acid deacylase
MLDMIAAARSEGLDVRADQYPYAAGSTMLFFLVPGPMKTSAGVKEAFKTKKGRAEIKKHIERQFTSFGPEKILITQFNENQAFEGLYLNEIADMMGTSPAEAFVELVCADEQPMAVFFSQEMEIVNALMAQGDLITVSDGWTVPKDLTAPHPRVYGTFPRKIRKFALDQKLVELTAAIHSMTGMSAAKFNIKDRGTIREGHFADIAVLDLNHLTDKATYKDPHQYATGIEYLFVNGKLAIDKKQATGCRAGIPIRRS